MVLNGNVFLASICEILDEVLSDLCDWNKCGVLRLRDSGSGALPTDNSFSVEVGPAVRAGYRPLRLLGVPG